MYVPIVYGFLPEINVFVFVFVFVNTAMTRRVYGDLKCPLHCSNNDWNHLSHDCVNANSVNMFKRKIDNYTARAGYT